jgi:hypothetical protein
MDIEIESHEKSTPTTGRPFRKTLTHAMSINE